MNKAFVISFFICIYSSFFSQNNLIIDGGFENYTSCPNSAGLIFYNTYWFQPTQGSPDLFNKCDITSNLNYGVPFNGFGIQKSHNGNGYCGLGLKETVKISDYKEYITTKLKSTLVNNHRYKFSCFYSLADSSKLAINKISVLFSNDSLSAYKNINGTIPLLPQLNLKCNNCFYTDTANWIELEGEYVAVGFENYLTIGCFDSIINQEFNIIKSNFTQYDSIASYSYYYFDDVSLVDLIDDDFTIPNIFTPNGDGVNDVFRFENISEIKNVIIFDRWGLKVFETNLQNNFWDGRTISGLECSSGIFYFIIESEKKTYKGFVHLIR